MKENTTKPTKKKRLLFWLTLAASLLIIAAIAVGVVFAVRGNRSNLTIENPPKQDKPDNDDGGNKGDNNPDDGKNDDDNKDKPGDAVDTSSQYVFISPIEEVNLIKVSEFCYDKTMDWYRLHQAIDFGAPAGTNVLAAVDGTVTSIVERDTLDYAVIEIKHANDLTTVYKFLDPAEGLKVGQKVSRGQVIGTVAAASGKENADGEHLHFEVLKAGKAVDPDEYLNLSSK